jgi:hypothetical protein
MPEEDEDYTNLTIQVEDTDIFSGARGNENESIAIQEQPYDETEM